MIPFITNGVPDRCPNVLVGGVWGSAAIPPADSSADGAADGTAPDAAADGSASASALPPAAGGHGAEREGEGGGGRGRASERTKDTRAVSIGYVQTSIHAKKTIAG